MPKIMVFECRFTKKLFKQRSEFITHLKKLRGQQKKDRDVAIKTRQIRTVFDTMRQTCATIAEIEQYISDNFEFFVLWSNQHDSWRNPKKAKNPTAIKVTLKGMMYHHSVSNTHQAPFGKKTNWHQSPDLPSGYPGWKGRIHIPVMGPAACDGVNTDVFTAAGLKTGSGSGSHLASVYDVSLFADDWPGLVMNRVMTKLSTN